MAMLLYPPFLQWEVVSECNHKCIHCYNYWRASNLAVENCDNFDLIAKKIIERKPLYLAITGGEPLLVFDKIKDCITDFVKNGIVCSISTNGTLLNEEIVKFLSANKVDLVISLPSINKEVCDKVCSAKNVVDKLSKVWPLLKKYKINTTINVVINKLNINTLYETLESIKKLDFTARVGIAQRPINASQEYLQYELDKSDFNFVVKECIRAKKELNLPIDFSVCIPDCAFDSLEELNEIEKGDCFAGTIAYAITTNGDVKACQCDTRVYGNILKDDFASIYNKMVSWRNGDLIPAKCKDCPRLNTCRGGCRVESYANSDDYHSMPTFADADNVLEYEDNEKLNIFSDDTIFELNPSVNFLKDFSSYRVSVGIIPVYLSNEFAEWLIRFGKKFSFAELKQVTKEDDEYLNAVVNMLVQNNIINIAT